MSEQPAPRWVDVGGVVFDAHRVPDKDEPAESHIQLGETYTQDDGTEVIKGQMVAGPAPEQP